MSGLVREYLWLRTKLEQARLDRDDDLQDYTLDQMADVWNQMTDDERDQIQ